MFRILSRNEGRRRRNRYEMTAVVRLIRGRRIVIPVRRYRRWNQIHEKGPVVEDGRMDGDGRRNLTETARYERSHEHH